MNRRLVLKGMALGGAASFAIGHPAQLFANASWLDVHAHTTSLKVLVNDDAAGARFLSAAAAAGVVTSSSRLVESDVQVLLSLERDLRGEQALRVIGLLDDALGTLVVDMARSAGARLRWLGHHSVNAGSARHQVLHTNLATACVDQLERACSAGDELVVQRPGEASSSPKFNAAARPRDARRDWVALLGYRLGSLREGDAGAMPVFPGRIDNGRFVSFSIER
jgi:hypothetical protein